jgi:LPS export ABC transporter protein LptC
LKKIKIIYVLLLGAFFIFHCTDFEKEEEGAPVEEYPDQESWDNNIYFSREGERRAVLNAGYIAKYHKKKHTILKEGVTVHFYGDDGTPKSVLTSEEGKVYDDKQDMTATGNVIVKSKNGTILYSDELYWANKEGKIISNVPVKITTETDTLFGDTFKSDPDLIDYEITNAHGTSEQKISIDEE